MEIVRIGLAPIKGLRHLAVDFAEVDPDGLVGDHAVALVDPATMTTLTSAEDDVLHQVVGTVWDGVVRVELLDGRSAEQPLVAPGVSATVSYWGRPVSCSLVDGEVAVLLSDVLGREVLLAPAPQRRSFVWDAAVSVAHLAEIDAMAERLGQPGLREDLGRFRTNLVLDGPALREGDRIELGEVVLEVEGDLDRAARREPAVSGAGAADAAEFGPDDLMLGSRCRVVRGGVLHR